MPCNVGFFVFGTTIDIVLPCRSIIPKTGILPTGPRPLMTFFAPFADFCAFASRARYIAVPSVLLQIQPCGFLVRKPFEEVIRAYSSFWAIHFSF